MGIRPQRILNPNSQTAEDFLKQTEISFHDVRTNPMQAYIKNKAYYDKRAITSKINEQQYVYILQLEADHQGSKILFTGFL